MGYCIYDMRSWYGGKKIFVPYRVVDWVMELITCIKKKVRGRQAGRPYILLLLDFLILSHDLLVLPSNLSIRSRQIGILRFQLAILLRQLAVEVSELFVLVGQQRRPDR